MALEDLLSLHYKKLNENDLHIWNYISAHRKECCGYTIEQLAKKCDVSRTTILRFAQKLSMSGFSELKIYLKMECGSEKKQKTYRMEDVCNNYRKLIDDMEKKDCHGICRQILNAKRIFVHGTGAIQSLVAKELKRAFLSAHICMYDVEGGWGETDLVTETATEEDLVFIISLSGESENAISFAKKLKLKNVPIISITKLKDNELARLSVESLYISTSYVDTDYAVNYETTTLFYMTVEMLFVKYLLFLDELHGKS